MVFLYTKVLISLSIGLLKTNVCLVYLSVRLDSLSSTWTNSEKLPLPIWLPFFGGFCKNIFSWVRPIKEVQLDYCLYLSSPAGSPSVLKLDSIQHILSFLVTRVVLMPLELHFICLFNYSHKKYVLLFHSLLKSRLMSYFEILKYKPWVHSCCWPEDCRVWYLCEVSWQSGGTSVLKKTNWFLKH